MTRSEEEQRAQAFRESQQALAAEHRERQAMLAGDEAAARELFERMKPVTGLDRGRGSEEIDTAMDWNNR